MALLASICYLQMRRAETPAPRRRNLPFTPPEITERSASSACRGDISEKKLNKDVFLGVEEREREREKTCIPSVAGHTSRDSLQAGEEGGKDGKKKRKKKRKHSLHQV
ncbi:hypothetical protein EYF80_056940 [Liparis tanakae]|uniref:Uncharacterized protein n=1 Tax=Liparis tanakae TaxID=230148 RepID=A0A4Z2EVI5_9TELE|nr:hypothetical protein EYF80_056940 [Liparis tanakae]